MEALTSSLLYLNGVTVAFDGFKALNNLSFAIESGEMRAIIGPNGAGKTTMMDVVTGKTRPDLGDVMFDGSYDLTRLDEAEIAELGIGRKFQKPAGLKNPPRKEHPGAGPKTRPPCPRRAAVARKPAGTPAHRPVSGNHPSHRRTAPPRRQPVARTTAMARNRDAARP